MYHKTNKQISILSGESFNSEDKEPQPKEDGVILRYSTIEPDAAPKIYTKVRSRRVTEASDEKFQLKVTSRNSSTLQIPFEITDSDPIKVSIQEAT
ncbi:hypothetical protein [Halorubrum ezzemoulense]|uniref:hypothetical protein n=1 Tax=Halorubrum ezzemoulense TaxID=337243 RepID=UPI00232CF3AF|nr:hypothetical protein [Halorubrum ezzemoulense]